MPLTRLAAFCVVLDVTDTPLSAEKLCVALRAAGSVEQLYRNNVLPAYGVQWVTELFRAAPRMRELHTSVLCDPENDVEDAIRMLEARPPFGPLRMHCLCLGRQNGALPPALAAALGDNLLQPGMKLVIFADGDLSPPGALDAVADALVARESLDELLISGCVLAPTNALALARTLHRNALKALKVINCRGMFVDAAGAVTLGDALRANTTLEELTLFKMLQLSAPVVAALLAALVGHRSLECLSLSYTIFEDPAAAGVALAALLIADAPALTELDVSSCGLDEAGLGAVLDALPRNSHLRALKVHGNSVPDGFMRARLLPAVRANTSLREVVHKYGFTSEEGDNKLALEEAQRIIAERR